MRPVQHLPRALAVLLFAALVGGCRQAPDASTNAYRQSIELWRSDRLARLTAEDGWLTLVGLAWLEEGQNRVGAGEDNAVQLPTGRAPAFVGTLVRRRDKVHFTAAPGVDITYQHGDESGRATDIDLASEESGEPTVLQLGTLSFYVIERSGRIGVRVKDSASPVRTGFRGLENFPIDPQWRILARFEKYEPPRQISIVTVLQMVEEETSPGALVFEKDGRTLRLDALQEGDQLFVIFSDVTSGQSTYGAGRYLYAPMPGPGGTVVLDFNKAYTPPCAFTAYATCPLPPPTNRLPIAVEAGEKTPPGHH